MVGFIAYCVLAALGVTGAVAYILLERKLGYPLGKWAATMIIIGGIAGVGLAFYVRWLLVHYIYARKGDPAVTRFERDAEFW